jgi:hypothetical protein
MQDQKLRGGSGKAAIAFAMRRGRGEDDAGGAHEARESGKEEGRGHDRGIYRNSALEGRRRSRSRPARLPAPRKLR